MIGALNCIFFLLISEIALLFPLEHIRLDLAIFTKLSTVPIYFSVIINGLVETQNSNQSAKILTYLNQILENIAKVCQSDFQKHFNFNSEIFKIIRQINTH